MTAALIQRAPGYVVRQLPPFAVAMGTAELFFRFGSFTLECLAFLALWWCLAQLYRRLFAALGISAPGG